MQHSIDLIEYISLLLIHPQKRKSSLTLIIKEGRVQPLREIRFLLLFFFYYTEESNKNFYMLPFKLENGSRSFPVCE